MKYTLLLDSSNTKLAVGIARDDQLLESIIYEAWQEQSEHMIPEINGLLEKYDVDRNDIESVMVAVGPGSYTGVRISITIAKIISVALNVKVYPVSSLQILKNGKKPSICVENARSSRSYVGVYEDDKCLLEDKILTNDELLKYIESHKDFILCGETKYLGLEGYVSNTIEEMFSLKNNVVPMEDATGLKPVYLKD